MRSLEKNPEGGRREAFKKFIQRKRKAGDIERLKSRLKEHQIILDTRVMIDIRQTINRMSSQQDSEYSNVEQQLSSIVASLASCEISTAGILRTAIKNVIEANKQEHERTRSHFDSTVRGWTSSQTQRNDTKERHDRFLESLRFDDMNLRGNEISESHQKTFGWIFKDDTNLAWDNFNRWLQKGQDMYWINGKAGSGKSTLMKFIVEDERTAHALNSWASGRECMILKFYFWLSGSKLQRARKGFLCTLLHQAMSDNGNLIECALHNNRLLAQKRTVGDWSLTELKDALQFVFKQLEQSSKVCIFLDGLDEFDQDDDIDQLLDLIEEYAHSESVKFCVSSRPDLNIEKRLSVYKRLRLQDLTAHDMQLYIRDTLELAYEKHPSNSIKAEDIDDFAKMMTDKADGVFLWVHLALNNLIKGLRNEDVFRVLLKRLEKLPSGMEQLYQQMWGRLNGDEQIYREEASTYFSYHENFPLSLFEFMVALNGDIQARYLQNMRPQNPREMAQRCRILEKQILTRCAGLLEVVIDASEASSLPSSSSETSLDNDDSTESRSESMDEPQEEASQNNQEIENQSPSSQISASGKTVHARDSNTELKGSTSTGLRLYQYAKITFLHRTARDFLLGTKAGHDIAGETSQTRDERLENLIRALMAALIQELTEFRGGSIKDIMDTIGSSDTEYEIELLKDLRRLCETLGTPGSESRDINRIKFWKDGLYGGYDFLGSAALHGCKEYVKYCIDHEIEYASSYYQGYLFTCAVHLLDRVSRPLRYLELLSWLAQNGADLHTRHWYGYMIQTPFQYLLEQMLHRCYDYDEYEGVLDLSQMAELIQANFPTAFKSTEKYIVCISKQVGLESTEGQISDFYVELGASCCCRLALLRLARRGVKIGSIRQVPSRSEIPLRDLLFEPSSTRERCMRPNVEDSIHLGQAYEKVLFPEDYAEDPAKSRNDFISCLDEVIPRCDFVEWSQWARDIGYGVELPEDAMVLDPSEDVDETNWRERGWFRKNYPIVKEEPSEFPCLDESAREWLGI